MAASWEKDLLGEPYERMTLPFPDDDEGPVVATLVRRRTETPTRRAVLYVHGHVDYFFQRPVADFWVAAGYDFYALDLRKNGRSLRDHQTLGFCRSVTEYVAELDAAARIIRTDPDTDGHDHLIANAHSLGALITTNWAHTRRDRRGGRGELDALILNSPFLDLNIPAAMRGVSATAVSRYGFSRPYAVVPFPAQPFYGESIHQEHRGEWAYDLDWKPVAPIPIRAGWVRAIRSAHRRLHDGLAVPCPVLVLTSDRTVAPRQWDESLHHADAVLDVAQIARRAPAIGHCVTIQRIPGGMHDLALSPEPARALYFDRINRWLSGYSPQDPPAAP